MAIVEAFNNTAQFGAAQLKEVTFESNLESPAFSAKSRTRRSSRVAKIDNMTNSQSSLKEVARLPDT